MRHVCATGPGIARRRPSGTFRYLYPDGSTVRDRATLARIKALAIPPAWRDVWICPRPDGHLQATGRDARGRKQYRYHRDWREVRDQTKFSRMIAFARALPRIRARMRRDLARSGLPREKVLATIVRLLQTTFMRVGNEEYARENASFGLTTLRERQVRINGTKLKFEFRGKSGVQQRIELNDRRLARIVRRMRDLPGQELFQYVDDDGERRTVDSADVNAYLKETAGEEFTSKDFRTFAGTLLAARALCTLAPCRAAGELKRNVGAAIEAVAKSLGNTKAVCRKCYIHPAVLESYLDGSFAWRGASDEAALVRLLRERLKLDAQMARRSAAGGRSLTPVLARSLQLARRAEARAA